MVSTVTARGVGSTAGMCFVVGLSTAVVARPRGSRPRPRLTGRRGDRVGLRPERFAGGHVLLAPEDASYGVEVGVLAGDGREPADVGALVGGDDTRGYRVVGRQDAVDPFRAHGREGRGHVGVGDCRAPALDVVRRGNPDPAGEDGQRALTEPGRVRAGRIAVQHDHVPAVRPGAHDLEQGPAWSRPTCAPSKLTKPETGPSASRSYATTGTPATCASRTEERSARVSAASRIRTPTPFRSPRWS